MQSDFHIDNDFLQKSASILEDLLAKCYDLLEELEQFREFLVKRNKEQTVELRPFRNSIQSELKSLERVGSRIVSLADKAHITTSSLRQIPVLNEQSILFVHRICPSILQYGQRQSLLLAYYHSTRDSIGRTHQDVARTELVDREKDVH